MATHANGASSRPAFAKYDRPDPIDLTADDDGGGGGHVYSPTFDERSRIVQPSPFGAYNNHSPDPLVTQVSQLQPWPERGSPRSVFQGPLLSQSHGAFASTDSSQANVAPTSYRPVFAGFAPPIARERLQASSSYVTAPPPVSNHVQNNISDRQVIDLTGSPSPPPSIHQNQNPLPYDLPPKTPVCIGELTVTALVLYPIPYLRPLDQRTDDPDWAPIRLQYEHNPNRLDNSETIHIKSPHTRTPTGEVIPGETFGVVEQKVATFLGPMLGKGLIRLDGKVRRGMPNLPILPLQMLVFTPKGNIPVVGNYLRQNGLLLEHPSPSYDAHRLTNYYYFNPHNPPPGGHSRPYQLPSYPSPITSRWTAPAISGKSVEVQRSQIDELFKSLKSGDELVETEPSSCVATGLYPHQKKALTFLLEREREQPGKDGKFSTLWQERTNPMSGQTSWVHIVTQREEFREPKEAKGAILADDMGLGKTITCVALIAATLESAQSFADTPLSPVMTPTERVSSEPPLSADHFAGSVWGMPGTAESGFSSSASSAKAQAKAAKLQDKVEADYIRAYRIKTRSRATLIVCPLSTVANWEEQFREHWKGEVSVIGGANTSSSTASTPKAGPPVLQQTQSQNTQCSHTSDTEVDVKQGRIREGRPLRVYVYHGNARRPDPTFLADFDAVITTYATLATEFSKQSKTGANTGADDEDEGASSDPGGVDYDERGNAVLRLPQPTKNPLKRKKLSSASLALEVASPLQSVHWFRVVLDEAHAIKETSTVASRASCDLMADRRLCLTGTPVQNKLDDVFALIKFLRVNPFDDKTVWTEFIGSPVKYGQPLGVARLQTIMKCTTLRRTKETKTADGQRILSLPPRRDELRYLKFDEQEQKVYDQFFNESKAEFNELSDKNEVMKNYVGILQKILRLRQICDHFELVKGKDVGGVAIQDSVASYEEVVAAIDSEGLNGARAATIFALLRESGTSQCVECAAELSAGSDAFQMDCDLPAPVKRVRKNKSCASRGSTRANSPAVTQSVLTRCLHLFCLECFRNCVCPGWPHIPPDMRRSCSACQTCLAPTDAVEVKPDLMLETTIKKKSQKKEKRQRGLSLENFHPSTKVKALLGDLLTLSRTNPYSNNYDPDTIEVQMVDDQGNDVDDGIVKTVVFSQWTSMLDKVEDALEAAGIQYERLDGTMKREERSRAMEMLKHDPRCEVLLVSLKAGGVGLNLTAAQRVYLMDPYWNPAVENQAVDRIHRLGQTRPVTTVKLIIENSIEARLLEVQKKKTALANMTLGQTYTKAEMLQRRMEELSELFGS